MELDKIQLSGYETLTDTTLMREETLEMIVPDACPDILRIVETDGEVLLKSREITDGRVEAAGCFQLRVLYLPDGESGLRQLPVALPFTCSIDDPGITAGCRATISMRLHHADTRMINPRKVLVRGEAAVDVTVFSPVSKELATRVLNGEEQEIEQLTEPQELYTAISIQEKAFTLSDQISLSSGKPEASELLKSSVILNRGESKLIGNKFIFKGSALLTLLYRGEDDAIYSNSSELPYSQIMEVTGAGENSDCELVITLTELDCTLSPGDGRTVTVSLEALAQAAVQETRTFDILTDAYSVRQNLRPERELLPAFIRLDRGSRSQSVRDLWETDTPIREVLDCRLTLGQIDQLREGDKLTLTAQTEMTVLYLGEDGSLYSAQRQISVPCTLDLPEYDRCLCRCEEAGDAYTAPAAGGIETRFTLDFHYCATMSRQFTVLSDLTPEEQEEQEGTPPSLVLRMLEQGERLWDVAKFYRTTISDIMGANELADESAASGRLLLIPRKR